MDPLVLTKLNAARHQRKAALIVTNLSDGRDRMVLEGDKTAGELGEAVEQSFKSGKSRQVEIGDERFFLNVHVPAPRLVVIGAVHISQAMAPIARTAGYDMQVIDPRTAFATVERFGDVELYADWPEDVLKDHPLDAYTALAAVTHDPKIDDFPITAALNANCFYVGALGSKKTHGKRLERLSSAGVTEKQLEKIHAPIGMDIGASSPAEIAVAVMAEVINAFRNRGPVG